MTLKDKRRDYQLRRKYGITLSQYREQLAKQGNSCWICERSANTFKRSLAVDHCHKTLVIRGLLCPFCNRGLRFYGDDFNRFRRGSEYLQQNTGWYAPKPKRKSRSKRKRRKR